MANLLAEMATRDLKRLPSEIKQSHGHDRQQRHLVSKEEDCQRIGDDERESYMGWL